MTRSQIPLTLLFCIMAINLIQPMSVDVYIPAVDAIGKFFHATSVQAEYTLSLFMLGLACGQLIFGPLSDHFGRRPILLAGGLGYVCATIACMHVNSIEVMIGLRFIQAVMVSAAMTTAYAMVRDCCKTQQETGRMLALVGGSVSLSTGIAPFLGGALVLRFGWHGVFMFMCLFMLMLMLLGLLMPETNKEKGCEQGKEFWPAIKQYASFLKHRQCMTFSFIYGMAFSGFIAYMTVSSWLWIHIVGIKASAYPFYFALNAIGFGVSGVFTAWLGKRGVPQRTILSAALIMIAACGVAMYGLFAMQIIGVWSIVPPMIMVSFGVTMAIAASMSFILVPFPDCAAQATAFAQCMSMVLCSVVGSLTADWFAHSIYALPATIIITSVAGLVVLGTYQEDAVTQSANQPEAVAPASS
jgi:MFS transporter, DHA1 family, multidrug resistance protein